MNSKLTIPNEVVISKIYYIRDQKVMLDRDLATLYDVKNIRLREQVKRNPDKFPEHFMFRLDESEVEIMVSQNAIPSKKHLGGSLPYVFAEHGILHGLHGFFATPIRRTQKIPLPTKLCRQVRGIRMQCPVRIF